MPETALLTIACRTPRTIADVLTTLRDIDRGCGEQDGLHWFNWLYLQVTESVAQQTSGAGFRDPAWLAELDVQFARLYLNALAASLTGAPTPGCWRQLFWKRDRAELCRVQFAMAGINAHINHDLAVAIVNTCEATGTQPNRGGPHYADYTAVNGTLQSLIDEARNTLRMRLLGDAVPPVAQMEDAIAAWNMGAARELAWRNAEHLWHLRGVAGLREGFLDMLDGFSTVIGKALTIPAPRS